MITSKQVPGKGYVVWMLTKLWGMGSERDRLVGCLKLKGENETAKEGRIMVVTGKYGGWPGAGCF